MKGPMKAMPVLGVTLLLIGMVSINTSAGKAQALPLPEWREMVPEPPADYFDKFRQVDPGVFAGSAPKSEQAIKWMADNGFRTILDLRFPFWPESAGIDQEKSWTENYPILQYLPYPIEPFVPCPKETSLDALIVMIKNPLNQPIYVHCNLGKHRTGMVIGAYRVTVDGWTVEDAIREMEEQGFDDSPGPSPPFLDPADWKECLRKYYPLQESGTVVARTPTGFYYPTGSKPAGPLGNGSFGSTKDDGGYPVPGVWHCGFDIEGEQGDPVFAIADGDVVLISENGWSSSNESPENFAYLICHTLSNGQKFVAVYGHVRRPWTLNVGDHVCAGNEIGCLGPLQAGQMGGPHLHFGVYQDRNEPDSCNYPSIFGRQKLPRPDAEFVDGVLAYGNWFDPISFIEKRMPSIPIGGNGSAIAVIMDRSGSMAGEKIAKAQQAASSLFAILHPEDYACLVTFSPDARLEVGMLQATPLNQTFLQQTALSIQADQSTNITSGLSIGFDQLVSASDSLAKFAVLLSDGMHNTGIGPFEGNPSIVEQFHTAGWPIYTVAYGQGSDLYSGVDLDTLGGIATETGGTLFLADPFNVTQIYQKINAQISNQSVLFSYNDMIAQGQQLTYELPIDSDTTSATFFADWQGSVVDFKLQTPEVLEISPDDFGGLPGVSYQKGDTFCFYQIDNPTPGNWQAILFGEEINQPKEQVNLTVSTSSSLLTNILGLYPSYQQGDIIHITAQVMGLFGPEPELLSDVRVSASIKKPSPNLREMLERHVIDIGAFLEHALFSRENIELYDDGVHNDGEAGDGLFGSDYTEADVNGCYVVKLMIVAKKPDGEEISRVLWESIQVGPIEDNTVTLADFLGL
jgi:murein DD-endopeptidase MepM/ murein hydrolase activator NlpD